MSTPHPTPEEMVRWLDANGEAGDVECDPDGTPVYQVYVAQAGPVNRGATVCVLTQERSEAIAHAIRSAAEMREALAAEAAKSPPDDWQTRDMWGDYNDYPGMVDDVDPSNSGDVHDHGYEQGRWAFAKIVRAILGEV